MVKRLDELYPKTPVPLNHKNKFELLIAVLLSAQCTDERVNQVTPSLFSLANNPFAMSKIEAEKIYEIIRPVALLHKNPQIFRNCLLLFVKNIKAKFPQALKISSNFLALGTKLQVLSCLRVSDTLHFQLIRISIDLRSVGV